MSAVERVAVALLAGSASGGLMAAAAIASHQQHIWPGTISGASMFALTLLLVLGRRAR